MTERSVNKYGLNFTPLITPGGLSFFIRISSVMTESIVVTLDKLEIEACFEPEGKSLYYCIR